MDDEGVLFTGIQMLICANKWDKIESFTTPSKAVLARALRCVAHAHGCHLVYTASTSQKPHELMQKKLRTILTHMMFSGFERKLCATLFQCIGVGKLSGLVRGHSSLQAKRCSMQYWIPMCMITDGSLSERGCVCSTVTSLVGHTPSRTHPEVAPDAPLCVLHGTDSFTRIGLPDGTRIVDRDSALATWRAEVKKTFPAPAVTEGPPPIETFEPNNSTHPPSCAAFLGYFSAKSCARLHHVHPARIGKAVQLWTLQIREHVKTMEAKAVSEKRRSIGRKPSVHSPCTL
jgi:hypothetical protein